MFPQSPCLRPQVGVGHKRNLHETWKVGPSSSHCAQRWGFPSSHLISRRFYESWASTSCSFVAKGASSSAGYLYCQGQRGEPDTGFRLSFVSWLPVYISPIGSSADL